MQKHRDIWGSFLTTAKITRDSVFFLFLFSRRYQKTTKSRHSKKKKCFAQNKTLKMLHELEKISRSLNKPPPPSFLKILKMIGTYSQIWASFPIAEKITRDRLLGSFFCLFEDRDFVVFWYMSKKKNKKNTESRVIFSAIGKLAQNWRNFAQVGE